MKCKFTILSLIILFSCFYLHAQQQCNLHIITQPGNLAAPFKFNFNVNGSAYKLKAGHCLELQISADSINIALKDYRWVKNETIDVNTKAEKDVYVLIRLVKNKKIMKGEFYMAETICKECFEELRKRCTKEISEAN